MRTFTDIKGDQWTIVFTSGDAMRLRRELGFDVDDLASKSDRQIEELLFNGNKILEILVLLLEDQIISRGLVEKSADKLVLAEEFGHRFTGDTIDDATLTFLNAVADSLPKFKRRGLLEIIQKISPAIETAIVEMETKIQELDLTEDIRQAIRNE